MFFFWDPLPRKVFKNTDNGGFYMADLRQLAEEYSLSADLLEDRMLQLQRQLAQARGQEALDLQNRLDVMNQELFHTRRMRAYLNEYYC